MTFFIKKFTGAMLCISLSVAVSAESLTPTKQPWLMQQINQHPDIMAAKEIMNAAYSAAEGKKKAIYNPELETDVVRETSYNNFTLGINQTLDWNDKQGARTQQANFSLMVAKQNFDYLLQKKTAQALQALISWRAAKKQALIATAQEQQLGTLLDLVAERQQVGDLGQVDAELTYLSLSQTLNTNAQAQVQLKQAQAQVKELLPNWTPELQVLPEQGLTTYNEQVSQLTQQQWLNQHPLVLAAKAQWQVSKGDAQQSLLATKADPTIGFRAGKTDNENTFGVSFSIPLNIRNDFTAEARSANQQAIAAESSFRAVKRKQKFDIQASTDSLLAYKKHYLRWQKLMQGRGKRSEDLLQKQWQSGDMSTTEYLLALQQRANGLSAGIELQSQFQLSQITWLLQIGQINIAVNNLLQ
jgi:outer membrane protein, heavy metal efflux system